MTTPTKTRSERLDVRVTPDAKLKLQQAAEVRHKTLSEFVLDSALRAADNTIQEPPRINLDAKQWQQFLAALDAPAKPAPRLAQLFQEPSPFE